MAGRPCPRTSSRGGPGGGAGSRMPALTKTQALRQAKSAAFVKDTMGREAVERARASCPPSKPSVPRMTRGPPPAEPKRVDFRRPGLTKAHLARMRHAEQLAQSLDRRKQEEVDARRRPQRTNAPLGGDARFGREAGRSAAPSCPSRQPQAAGPSGGCPSSSTRKIQQPLAHSTMRKGRRLSPAGQSRLEQIPEKTCELARSMNAEVIQVEPVGEGPVDSIVIPPGTVNDCRTTIVSIPRANGAVSGGDTVADRSIQVINETLDDQDAAEAAAVNDKLNELQTARREFVLAVATVGGNAVNLAEQGSPRSQLQRSPEQTRGLYAIPEVSDDIFRIDYGRDHPSILAARDFMQRSNALRTQRESQMRIEREFAAAARRASGGLRLDVPIEQEIMEGDISFEEDEETGMIIPCESRIRASMPAIPQRKVPYYAEDAVDIDQLERFFNVQQYPDLECPVEVPPGREGLNPDLWYLEDPWYHGRPVQDEQDLIDFSEC